HGACGAPETSAPQCPHALASTSRRCVGFGCNGRCAPGCGFFLRRLFTNSVVFLWPWLGGTLELFGVFGGRSCLACRRATSASRLVTFAIKRSFDSASAKATPSSPSRSSESNAFRFIGSVNHTLILRSMAQVNGAKTLLLNDRFQKTGVSNYEQHAPVVIDLVLEPGISLGVGARLPLQDDRLAVRHDEAVPDQERAGLAEGDL